MKKRCGASSFGLGAGSLRLLPLVLFCCAGQFASAGQRQAPAQTTSIEHVRGVVRSAVDGKPVPRVLVSSGDQRMATLTDSEGRFAFDVRRVVPATRSFDFLVSNNGINGQRMSVFLTAYRPGYLRKQMQVALAADPTTASEDIELKIVPEAVIRGRLSASGGEVPVGVQVTLRRRQVQDGRATWVQAGGVQTNGHGEYSFAELPAGEYKLMTMEWVERGINASPAPASSFGYAPAFYGEGNDFATAVPIRVHAGETVEADFSVRSTTLRHFSAPVAGAAQNAGWNVRAGSQDGTSGLETQYDPAKGTVQGYLPDGVYDLWVTSFGQPLAAGHGRVEIAGERVKAAPIQLTPDGTIQVKVRLEYSAKQQDPADNGNFGLAGRVMSRSLGPVGDQGPQRSLDLSIRSIDVPGEMAGLRNTPGKGDDDLVLENVKEGRYWVQANAYRGYVASMTSNGVDLLRQPLVVGAGGTSEPIEVTIRDDGAKLSGTFTEGGSTVKQGDFSDQYSVVCFPLDGTNGGQAQPSLSMGGHFQFENLAPGRYLVLASRLDPGNRSNAFRQTMEYRNEDVLRGYLEKGTVVTLGAGERSEIQVPLLTDEEN